MSRTSSAKPKSDETNDKENTARISTAEYRWVAVVILVVLFITMIPYLIGSSFANDRQFMWLGYNLDDSCVYLSWMRQAADGSTHVLNLFTTDPQRGMYINPLFWVLGRFSHLTHLPLIGVSHGARLIFGVGLLSVVWQLIARCTLERRARKLAFLVVCFASGLGWLPGLGAGPIDGWQPEAITFLSLYLSPLFAFSMMLQVGAVWMFLEALATGRYLYGLAAGICGFILAVTHTYDVITLVAVTGGFAVVSTVLGPRKSVANAWINAVITVAVAAPGVLFIYHELQTESVFQKRMQVPTTSASLINVFIGFGIPLVLAVYYLVISRKQLFKWSPIPARTTESSSVDGGPVKFKSDNMYQSMLAVWLVANIAVAYLPTSIFPFQRKMLQGADFPVAILAGLGLATLMAKLTPLRKTRPFQLSTLVVVLLLMISNIKFMLRDMESFVINLIQTTHMHRPYINMGEMEAMHWIEANTPASSAIQPLPWLVTDGLHIAPADMTLACFAPGLTHHKVYCGHWGETPDYGEKLSDLSKLLWPSNRMPDEAKIALLRNMQVSYLIFSQKSKQDTSADLVAPMFRIGPVPSYLKLVHSNADADVYQVNLPPT